jgi:hypothetical protein
MELVYISNPYTHKDASVMNLRAARVAQLTAKLQVQHKDTHTLLSVIVHGHEIANTKDGEALPHTWDYWEKHDYNILKRCDEMWVMCMPGWDRSVGVNAEIDFCREHNISVKFYTVEGERL